MKGLKHIVLFTLIIFPGLLFGQNDLNTRKDGDLLTFKPQFSFNTGTSFLLNGNGMAAYFAPSFMIPVSRRLSFEGGIIGSVTAFPGIIPFDSRQNSGTFSDLAVYGSAVYQLTSNLSIYGTGYKQLNKSFFPFSPGYLRGDSYSIGSSLKLGRGLTIGATIHVSENYNLYSPFPYTKGNPFLW